MSGSSFKPIDAPACELGESPLWHPVEQVLYWCDIPGQALHRFDPASNAHQAWPLSSEPGSLAPMVDGALLLAQRDGLWRFNTADGTRKQLAPPPFDPKRQRFNDGKADAQGRFWVGTIDDARAPEAALYCWHQGRLLRHAGGVAVGNGLGFSPDGATLYWADTKGHQVFAFDLDTEQGTLSRQRVWLSFAQRAEGEPLATYRGRPDGAAVDSEGAYWVALFEGRRLLRVSPSGQVLAELELPVQCPTMPCFGGPDLRTLYLTTARHGRSAEELARDPWAGQVLQLRVAVPGLPTNLALA